jgi:cobalt-precorrin 5A hydrolase
MMVAGIGCRRGTDAEEIEAVIKLALDRVDRSQQDLRALATLADKADEPGLREAARRLSLPLIACSAEAMRSVDDRITTISMRAKAVAGVSSVAEAAALVAAGGASQLLVARVATARATCALAEGMGP